MSRVIWKFGLFAGAILAVLMSITIPFVDNIGNAGLLLGYTTIVIGFLMIFFGVRSYRESEGAGKITFGRALTIGVAITLIGSVCYVGAWEVVSRNFMPNFAEKYSARVMESARAKGTPPAELAVQQKAMDEFTQSYKNPWYRMSMTMLEPLPPGLVLSLVAAGMLRRKQMA